MPRSKFPSALRFGRGLPAPALLALALAARASAAVVLDDPLQGSTSGTRSGGAFAGGGWKVTGKNDFVLWHVPTVKHGAVEWQVKGLNPGECRAGMEDHAELFHMYDFTYSNSDVNYAPGYRDNPFKHFVRKQGCIDLFPDRIKLVWKIGIVMNTGKAKGAEWVALPIGILAGGVEMEARRAVSFQVLHPLTGQLAAEIEKARGERFTLARGPGAYVLRGVFTDVPSTAA